MRSIHSAILAMMTAVATTSEGDPPYVSEDRADRPLDLTGRASPWLPRDLDPNRRPKRRGDLPTSAEDVARMADAAEKRRRKAAKRLAGVPHV